MYAKDCPSQSSRPKSERLLRRMLEFAPRLGVAPRRIPRIYGPPSFRLHENSKIMKGSDVDHIGVDHMFTRFHALKSLPAGCRWKLSNPHLRRTEAAL